jgi:hypothetical protein
MRYEVSSGRKRKAYRAAKKKAASKPNILRKFGEARQTVANRSLRRHSGIEGAPKTQAVSGVVREFNRRYFAGSLPEYEISVV